MSKSVIVIDAPESCRECKFRYDNYGCCEICILQDDEVDYFYTSKTKPDWCPLSPLPEKTDLQPYIDAIAKDIENDDYSLNHVSLYHYARGYNNCLNDILGGESDGEF